MKYVSPIITILALLLSSIGCLSAARCAFPGIPARASAWTDNGIYKNEVVWKRGTYFTEGHRIEYECKNGWQIPMSEQMSIQCQEDGTWTAKIPRCDRVTDWIPENLSNNVSGNGEEAFNVSEWSVTYPRNENKSYEITQITIKGLDKNTSVTVVLDGLECTRFDPKHLIFNCKNVTQDQTSERLLKINIKLKMNFGRPVIRPTVSTLLNEGDNCGIPPVPYGAHFEEKYSDSGRRSVFLICDASPILPQKPTSVACNQWSGKWGTFPECTNTTPTTTTTPPDSTTPDVQTTSFDDRPCGELTLPKSAIILRDEVNTITLGCPSPLQLNGSESITCDATDGTWKPQVGTEWPECVELQEVEPPLSQPLESPPSVATWIWITIGASVVGVVFFSGWLLFKRIRSITSSLVLM